MNLVPDVNENVEDIFHYETIMNARKAPKNTKRSDAPSASGGAAKKPVYEVYGLPSNRQAFDELGVPGPRADCFGCCWIAEKEMAAVPYEEVEQLINMIRNTLPKANAIALVKHVAAKYAKMRDEINADLDEGEEPLPEWTAASILDHLQGNHTEDPELYDWFTLKRYKELARIAENASVVRDINTGEIKIDPVQAKEHREYEKKIEELIRSDVTGKRFYSGGSHFEAKAASEGPLTLSGRKMFRRWGGK